MSALPCCTPRPNLYSSQRVSLLSPVTTVIRLPISDISAAVDSSYTPAVSTVTGSNQKRPQAPHTSGGFAPRLPALHALLMRSSYKYWYRHRGLCRWHPSINFPLENGNTVTRSEFLPSPLPTPTDSNTERTPTLCRPRLMTSFRTICLACRLALNLQESP